LATTEYFNEVVCLLLSFFFFLFICGGLFIDLNVVCKWFDVWIIGSWGEIELEEGNISIKCEIGSK